MFFGFVCDVFLDFFDNFFTFLLSFLPMTTSLRGSPGLSARRTKSSRPKGPLRLEVGARRAPKLLVLIYFDSIFCVSNIGAMQCTEFLYCILLHLSSDLLYLNTVFVSNRNESSEFKTIHKETRQDRAC